MITSGTFAFGAIDVNRLLDANAVKEFRNEVRVPGEVNMLGKSSTKISFLRFGGTVEADAMVFGAAKPLSVDEGFF